MLVNHTRDRLGQVDLFGMVSWMLDPLRWMSSRLRSGFRERTSTTNSFPATTLSTTTTKTNVLDDFFALFNGVARVRDRSSAPTVRGLS